MEARGIHGSAKRGRAQGSLFERVVDLDAVRSHLGIEGTYQVAMAVREEMLRTSPLYRELPLDVFDRAASRRLDERLSQIGEERGLFLSPAARIDFR